MEPLYRLNQKRNALLFQIPESSGLRMFAVDVARRAMDRVNCRDPKCLKVCEAAEQYIRNEITSQEMEFIRDQVWDASIGNISLIHQLTSRVGVRIISNSICSITKIAVEIAKTTAQKDCKRSAARQEIEQQIDFIKKNFNI